MLFWLVRPSIVNQDQCYSVVIINKWMNGTGAAYFNKQTSGKIWSCTGSKSSDIFSRTFLSSQLIKTVTHGGNFPVPLMISTIYETHTSNQVKSCESTRRIDVIVETKNVQEWSSIQYIIHHSEAGTIGDRFQNCMLFDFRNHDKDGDPKRLVNHKHLFYFLIIFTNIYNLFIFIF